MRWPPSFRWILGLVVILSVFGAVSDGTAQVRPLRHHGERDLDTPLLNGGALAPDQVQLPPKYPLAFYDFDPCVPQGWTSVDRTAQPGNFFHVDDFSALALPYAPLAMTKSLWCGARPQGTGPLCHYLALPGYGNNWDQAWCTKACINVSGDGLLDVTFLARFDSEPSYDYTTLEYTFDCAGATAWTVIDGGIGVWDGALGPAAFGGAYNIGSTGPVKVRLHFRSEGGYSDEDGFYDSNGAVIVDNLTAEGLALEDFEGEAVGATQSNDWITCNPPGCGDYAGVFPGLTLVQEDLFFNNVSCVWAFIQGSVNTYACGGFPLQAAVPSQCPDCPIWNEIWSPWIAWNPGGSVPASGTTHLEFKVYRDLPIDNLVFYTWHVRTRETPASCETEWCDRRFVYYSAGKDWYTHKEDVTACVPVGPSATREIQAALGVIDMCAAWGGVFGSGACHSHAPLFDDVEIYRDNTHSWTVNDMDLFQDNFSQDGTLTGTVRIDAATGGDAARLKVLEPGVGIDNYGAGKAVFCHVKNLTGKAGAAISGGPAWPYVPAKSTVFWTALQMNATANANEFNIDLNDQLYVPGDVIEFYFSATDVNGTTTYWSQPTGLVLMESEAQALPAEMTCLPVNANGNDILYVDAFSGHGAEPYFMSAFENLGITVDRFDKRAPSSLLGNGLASRVADPTVQLSTYRKIIWNTGDLVVGGLDAADYGVLLSFIGNLPVPGGLYFSGDNIATEWASSLDPSAIALRSAYMNFGIGSQDHIAASLPVSPLVVGLPGSCFEHAGIGDRMIAFGGSPPLKHFDVLSGPTVEMMYGTNPAQGAVVSRSSINNLGQNVGVLLAGFSYHSIRDDAPDSVPDRTHHLYDVLVWLQNTPPQPVAAGPAPARNWLGQNYPNPFNPVTTIEYSVRSRAHVSLVVYDASGARVRTLVDREGSPGDGVQRAEWNGRDDRGVPVASGVYFYRLSTGSFVETHKLVLLK
ncbi:MAG TPA: T9SS type A sorting domain-containing protein [Candidatus Krumholzibacteria bacterium]|nr:T9SS type A sorting domain-containing protein [Candidatus Krumholzibacteria bacterium]